MDLLSRLIHGEPPGDVDLTDADFRNTLIAAADYHGVRPLIARRLRHHDVDDETFGRLKLHFPLDDRSDVALDLIRQRELTNTINALVDHRVSPLLVKGAPLAYTHYPSPHMRPRADTDILIPANARNACRSVLAQLGYRFPNAVSGEPISHQFSAEKRDRFGVDHVLDVHWRLSNKQAFAGLLVHDELARGSVPVRELGANARALGPVHALLLACMHRVAHIHSPFYVDAVPHYGDRLIWLYDIHLLVTEMSPPELRQFAALAAEKRIVAVCLDGLMRARQRFDTPVPGDLLEKLSQIGRSEPSARYLLPGPLRHLMTELAFVPDWRSRILFLKALAFPPADYLLRSYAVSSRAWLPALYLHRGLLGVWKLVYRRRRDGIAGDRRAGASRMS